MLLAYDTLLVDVDSDDADDLEWLGEFLCPSFARIEGAAACPADCRVRLVRDTATFARWHERLRSAETARVRAFLLDTGPVDLTSFAEGDAHIAYDDFFDVFFRWRPATGRCVVDIVDGRGDEADHRGQPRRARVPLMRAVREWAMHHGVRRGRVFLHAAAIVRNDRSVLLAGPKRSGKTSLLTAILRHRTDVSYLANDRVMASRLDQGWRCLGMPSIVSIRPGSMDFLPGLEGRLRAVACGHTSRRTGTDAPVAFADGRFGLSPPQYCRLVGSQPVADAPLKVIAFPWISAAVAGVEVRTLSASEAAERVAGALFGHARADGPSELFDVVPAGAYPEPAARMDAASRLASDILCVEVGLGASAYRPDVIDGLLEKLFPPT